MPRHKHKPPRAERLAALPPEVRQHALVTWDDLATMGGYQDPAYAKQVYKQAGGRVVRLSARRELPTLEDVCRIFQSRGVASS
jgi:hypothetical protein